MAGGLENLSTRAKAVIAVVAVVVVVAVIAVLVNRGGDESSPAASDSPSAPGSSGSATTSPPTGSPSTGSPATDAPTVTASPPAPTTGPTEAPTPIPTRAPVELDEPADFGDGVTARIDSIRAVQGQGQGVGEISGPSLVVTLVLTNGTNEPLVVDQSTVNLAYGADGDPAAPLFGDERSSPFAGTVTPGGSTRARYVFNVPRRQRGEVRVTISHAALSPIVAFEGSAPR